MLCGVFVVLLWCVCDPSAVEHRDDTQGEGCNQKKGVDEIDLSSGESSQPSEYVSMSTNSAVRLNQTHVVSHNICI